MTTLSSLFQRCLNNAALSKRRIISSSNKGVIVFGDNNHLRRWLSSSDAVTSTGNPIPDDFDPSKFISGVTLDDFKNDPEIEEFIRFNLPDALIPAEKRETPLVGTGGGGGRGNATKKDGNESSSSNESKKKTFGQIRKEAQSFPLNIRKLYSYKRDLEIESGSNRCETMRNKGLVPGLLYGGDPNLGIHSHLESSKIAIKTPYNIIQAELDRYHRDFECRVYDLTVYEDQETMDESSATIHRVIPKNVQRHPVSDKWVYCCNFVRYFPGRPIKIPWRMMNIEDSPALKRDGYLIPVNKYVEVIIEDDTVPIPEYLELECTGVMVKDVLRLDRITFPDGVRPSDRIDKDKYLIGPIRGGRVSGTHAKSGDDDGDE